MSGILTIVEGHGDAEAAPVLVRRVLGETFGRYDVPVLPAYRSKVDLLRSDAVERIVEAAIRSESRADRVLVLHDADDHCPAELATAFRRRTQGHPSRPVLVAANRDFEAWFRACADQLFAGASPDLEEERSGAKAFVSEHLGRSYKERTDQVRLAARLDVRLAAERSRSFRRLVQAVGELIGPR